MQAAKRIMASFSVAAAAAASKRGLPHLVTSTHRFSTASAAASARSNSGHHRPNSVIRPNSERPSQEAIVNLLKMLDRDPHRALRFLGRVTGRHGLKPSATTYNLVASILRGEGNPVRDFWVRARGVAAAIGRIGSPIREVMARRDRGEMSIDKYLALLRRLRRSEMVRRAARLNQFVMDAPYRAKM